MTRGQAVAIISYAIEVGVVTDLSDARHLSDLRAKRLTRELIACARLDPSAQARRRSNNNISRSKVADAIILMAETMRVR